MSLKAEIVGEDSDSLFDSAAIIYDGDILDDGTSAAAVAVVLYSVAGNIVIWFRDGYDPLKVMVFGEKIIGQTSMAGRFKEYKAEVIKTGGKKCQRKSK